MVSPRFEGLAFDFYKAFQSHLEQFFREMGVIVRPMFGHKSFFYLAEPGGMMVSFHCKQLNFHPDWYTLTYTLFMPRYTQRSFPPPRMEGSNHINTRFSVSQVVDPSGATMRISGALKATPVPRHSSND